MWLEVAVAATARAATVEARRARYGTYSLRGRNMIVHRTRRMAQGERAGSRRLPLERVADQERADSLKYVNGRRVVTISPLRIESKSMLGILEEYDWSRRRRSRIVQRGKPVPRGRSGQ